MSDQSSLLPYRALQQRIDQLPVPFPATQTGVELELLRALFTEEEAAVALHLSAVAEPVDTIHTRVPATDKRRLAAMLANLAGKGAIQSGVTRVGSESVATYGLAPLVVGMFEFQVNRLTPRYVRDFHDYLEQGFRSSIVGVRTAQMRTVPVRTELSAGRAVFRYDDIRAYVCGHPGPFSVINCVCRQSAELVGQACTTSSTHETCLMIGHAVSHGRELSSDEVLEILDRAEREGHVLQPQNSREPTFICCCCRDCCEVLRNARKLPRPADAIPSAHRATVDPQACIGCKLCVRRCPMEAIAMSDGAADSVASVEEGRCIGCGLCTTTCPRQAITLVRRAHAPRPPRTTTGMYLRMYRDRWGLRRLVRLAVDKLLGRKI